MMPTDLSLNDDLLAATYTVNDIRAATGDAINANTLRVWASRGYLVLPREAAAPGLATPYHLIHVYVVRVLSEASNLGIKLEYMARDIDRHLMSEITGRSSGFFGDSEALMAADPATYFKNEFVDRDRLRPWFWVRYPTGIAAVHSLDEIGSALIDPPRSTFTTMINVTDIFMNVDDILKTQLRNRK